MKVAPTVAVDLRSHLNLLISDMTNEPLRTHRLQELRPTIGHVTTQIQQESPQN